MSRLAAVLVALASASCVYPATQVQVHLDTDAPPSRSLTVRVTARNGTATTGPGESASFVRGGLGTSTLPGSFTVTPGDGPRDSVVTVVVEAELAPGTASEPGARFRRLARFRFIPRTNASIPMYLPMACANPGLGCTTPGVPCTVAQRCEELGLTCGDRGECVSVDVVPTPVVDSGTEDVADAFDAASDITTSDAVDTAIDTVDASDASDVATDTATDVATDSGIDAPIDVGPDATVDDGPIDAGSDTSTVDAPVDAPVVIDPPRQLTPLSTATVTSQRPRFRWTVPTGGANGAWMEVCADRSCSTVLFNIDAMGTSALLPTALSPGVYYWRLYARTGGTIGTVVSAPGPVWQFTVGARSAPRDTSIGTTGDFDGDGYADAVVSAPGLGPMGAGKLFVYRGGPGGLATMPSTTLVGPDGADTHFGSVAQCAGDLDGDGYADLVVGNQGRIGNLWVYVFRGGPLGIGTTPSARIGEPVGSTGAFGYAVAPAGDVNGDGYGDLVVGSFMPSAGRAYVYDGSASGVATTPSTELIGADTYFGESVAGAADFDADGYSDVVVGTGASGTIPGYAYVYRGGASGLSTTPATRLVGPDGNGSEFGATLAIAGDVNGDGYPDLVVDALGAMGRTGHTYVFHGGAGGLATAPSTMLVGIDGAGFEFGTSVSSGGDIDGDGFSDVIVGAHYADNGAYVFRGSASGLLPMAANVLMGPEGIWIAFGVSSVIADFDRDGLGDALIGAYDAASSQGRAYAYRGTGAGLSTMPSTTLVNPDGVVGSFGFHVASWTLPRPLRPRAPQFDRSLERSRWRGARPAA